jgi:glucose-6-phosphate-specific signal transduction histidine kinase
LSEAAAFFGYRWLALLVAVLAMLVAGDSATWTNDVVLLVLVGVLTLSATALASGYVRVLRQRPVLLLLDLLTAAVLLWLSRSQPLPFLPYALSALVLPALLFGVRGALLSATAFTALDLLGCKLFNPEAIDTPLALLSRVSIPLAFALAWVAAARLMRRADKPAEASEARHAFARQQPLPADGSWTNEAERPFRVGALRSDVTPPPAPISSTPAPMLLARVTPEAQTTPARRLLYDLPTTPDTPLITSLEQLGTVARQSGLDVRVSSLGSTRQLNAAQQTVLLRTAQEAMQNVRQHAHATTVLLTLSFEPRAVTLVLQDDGVGLLDGTYERPGLHALRALRYRIAELDGQLAVFESESGGVTVRATLPLE